MLVLTRTQVEELLDLDALLEALASAHAELSAGTVSLPPRVVAFAGDAGLLGAMPANLPGAGLRLGTPSAEPPAPGRETDAGGALGCKLVTLFPHNTDRPSHQAVIALFDAANGTPVALMDGTHITAARTGAAAALAARLLARPDARTLAILGTGVQARSHARAFAAIRDWTEVRVAGRDASRAAALAAELGARACSFEDAVRGADVVAATTHSGEPVVRAEWVTPGTHVGSVGYAVPGSELDLALVGAAGVLAVESRSSAFAAPPAGAVELAGIDPETAVELGELVAGTRPGRTSPEQITLYKSVGVAVQDVAAAALVLAAARERGAGLEIELEEIHS